MRTLFLRDSKWAFWKKRDLENNGLLAFTKCLTSTTSEPPQSISEILTTQFYLDLA